MQCKKCVLSERPPEITLNDKGLCSVCQSDKGPSKANYKKTVETDLIRIIDRFKGRSKYDCLVMCSGGKDSTSSLYYACKRYKLNPLAFTFDNGFEQNQAIENVRKATDILHVDWLHIKSHFMFDMYREAVKKKATFPLCTLCSLWYMQLTYDVAQRYHLPLIFAGWTTGQMQKSSSDNVKNAHYFADPAFQVLLKDLRPFILDMRKNYSKYRNFPLDMGEVRKQYPIGKKVVVVSPHWFLPYDSEEYTQVIKEELGWKPLDSSYPKSSTNCLLNILASYMSLKYGGFTHFHVEMSKLIRSGQMTREESLEKLSLDIHEERTSRAIAEVLEKLGLTDIDI